MAQQNLSAADAIRIFEALTGQHPRSAKEFRAAYRVWMKRHHPDVTGECDPLSLEAVQWINAARDVLRKHDWTEPSSQAERAAHAGPDWTDVRDSTDEETQRWREQQQRKRQEEKQERQRRAEEIRRRNEELAKRPFWKSIIWGPDNLEYPGLIWCLVNPLALIVGFICSACLIYIISNLIIGSVSRIILGKPEDGDWFLGGIIGLALIGFTQSGLMWLWKSFRNRSRTT